MGLTPVRRRILDAMACGVEENGYPPTARALGQAVGLHSVSSVHHHLRRLVRDGLVVRVDGAGSYWPAAELAARAERLRLAEAVCEAIGQDAPAAETWARYQVWAAARPPERTST